jgi:nitrogen fixation protein NifU and related proteins
MCDVPLEVPDGVGLVGDPECGDYFKVFGCPAAVATCSMMSEMATGISVDEAYQLDDLDIMRALGGLPEFKQHCSNHAAAALHRAMDDYVLGGRTKRRGSGDS